MRWNCEESRYHNHRDSMSCQLDTDFEPIEYDMSLNMASQDDAVNVGTFKNAVDGSNTHVPYRHLEPIDLAIETMEYDINPHRSFSPPSQQNNIFLSFDQNLNSNDLSTNNKINTNDEDKTFKIRVLEKLKEIYGDTMFSRFNTDDHEPLDIKDNILMRTLKAFRPISVVSDVLILPPINKRLGTKRL